MTTPVPVYAQRRARLAAQLGKDGIAIIPTAPEQRRNRDGDYLYRHDSYFFYLSGFTEPKAWLVITGDGRTTVFCQPKDLEREIWDGYRLGPDAAPQTLGLDAAHSVTDLDTQLPKLLENRDAVWYPFATHQGLETRVDGWLQSVRVYDKSFEMTDDGRKLIDKPGAGPLWSRNYDLVTGRPIFGDKDQTIHDDVNEISVGRRNGYSWWISSPQKALDLYADWSNRAG